LIELLLMKVLFNCHVPFMLAHGGAQIQIEQTKAGLEKAGVAVEPLRWWDDAQTGQVLHHFGRIPSTLLKLGQQKGWKVVICDLLTEQSSRSKARLKFQKLVCRAMERMFPRQIVAGFNWDVYRLADACIANTPWEAYLMQDLFGAPREKVHVVPNGVEEVFLRGKESARGNELVCTATITERKRVVELAEAAIQARVPLWVIGKPYSPADPYAKRFIELAKQHSEFIRYEGAISDRSRLAEIYRQARGFVLLSTMETLSLSAGEAAACQCPLLLSDLPWARTVYGAEASYCPVNLATWQRARVLSEFYIKAPGIKPAFRSLSWQEIGEQLKDIYQTLLRTSR
jgi:glycosyltransferase involved in cell wall biosynthesis